MVAQMVVTMAVARKAVRMVGMTAVAVVGNMVVMA